ncbi:unnamed protein product [Linum trigynum]|uniref:Malonyl-CoA decarboxylase N-terminal domain-containing protein n=1 Tax=Linum trigynum TaxID=586398 RepID=A0AAV2GQ19_9ROSI
MPSFTISLRVTLASLVITRKQARELMDQHLAGDGVESDSPRDEAMLSAFYRIERNLRQALKPAYEVLFERLNNHPGGLRFLSTLRADILVIFARRKCCIFAGFRHQFEGETYNLAQSCGIGASPNYLGRSCFFA